MSLNNVARQRDLWRGVLLQEFGTNPDRIGYAWGDPEAADDPLGNYDSVRRRLRAALVPGESVVLEIGSYGGKWTRHMTDARQVICVDLFPESGRVLAQRFPGAPLVPYVTRGDELDGIVAGSVDLAFSMDSLVRAPLAALAGYLAAVRRVLRPGGRALLHLPWEPLAGSRERGFPPVTPAWLALHVAPFASAILDVTTLAHGLLLEVTA